MRAKPVCWITGLAIVALLSGCGGPRHGAGLPAPAEPSSPASEPADGAASPPAPGSALYRSPCGIQLYALGTAEPSLDGDAAALAVEEAELAENLVEWRVIDVAGVPRAIYFRVRFAGSGWGPQELYRGDWGGDKPAIFVPVPTPDRDLDVGLCPLAGQEPAPAECGGRVVARLVFERGTEKTASLGPLDQTLPEDSGGWHPYYHSFFPFTNPWELKPYDADYAAYKDYTAHWRRLDQQVEAVDESLRFERDKLENAFAADPRLVVEPYMGPHPYDDEAPPVECGVKVRFYGVLHGDYNRDGHVDVADIGPLSQYFGMRTDYDALAKSAPGAPGGHNPFALCGKPGDPYRLEAEGGARNDPQNMVDGSMDGVIDAPGTGGAFQRMYNALQIPPAEPHGQYVNDISAIGVHYFESLDSYEVSMVNTTPPPYRTEGFSLTKTRYYRLSDTAEHPFYVYPEDYDAEQRKLCHPFYYEVEFPYNLYGEDAAGSLALDCGTYDVVITPYAKWGDPHTGEGTVGQPTILRGLEVSFTSPFWWVHLAAQDAAAHEPAPKGT